MYATTLHTYPCKYTYLHNAYVHSSSVRTILLSGWLAGSSPTLHLLSRRVSASKKPGFIICSGVCCFYYGSSTERRRRKFAAARIFRGFSLSSSQCGYTLAEGKSPPPPPLLVGPRSLLTGISNQFPVGRCAVQFIRGVPMLEN